MFVVVAAAASAAVVVVVGVYVIVVVITIVSTREIDQLTYHCKTDKDILQNAFHIADCVY